MSTGHNSANMRCNSFHSLLFAMFVLSAVVTADLSRTLLQTPPGEEGDVDSGMQPVDAMLPTTDTTEPTTTGSDANTGNSSANDGIPTGGMQLPNCMTFLDSVYNLYWEVKGEDVTVGFEGMVDDGTWMGFGYQKDPSTAADIADAFPVMPGGDVIVVGVINGQGFAFDLFLGDYHECKIEDGKFEGVCLDTQLGTAADNNVKMESWSYVDGLLKVVATRPLKTPDTKFDNAWPTAEEEASKRFALWAMGTLKPDSTPELPMLMEHNAHSNSPTVLPLGTPMPDGCVPLGQSAPEPSFDDGNSTLPDDGGITEIVTLDESVTDFKVTVGELDTGDAIFMVNEYEAPSWTVVPGSTLTFTLAAGLDHAMYITDSALGGGDGTIFAGGAAWAGVEDDPLTVMWTVPKGLPDTLFYQNLNQTGWGGLIFVIPEVPTDVSG